jgi:hypothetical protein
MDSIQKMDTGHETTDTNSESWEKKKNFIRNIQI